MVTLYRIGDLLMKFTYIEMKDKGKIHMITGTIITPTSTIKSPLIIKSHCDSTSCLLIVWSILAYYTGYPKKVSHEIKNK